MSWRCRLRFVPHTSGACSISDSGREILVLICRVKGSLYCCYLVQVGFIVFTLGLFSSSKLSFWGGEHRRAAGRWNCLTFPIAVDFNHTLDVTEGPTLSFNSGFHTSSVLTVYELHHFPHSGPLWRWWWWWFICLHFHLWRRRVIVDLHSYTSASSSCSRFVRSREAWKYLCDHPLYLSRRHFGAADLLGAFLLFKERSRLFIWPILKVYFYLFILASLASLME